MKIIIKRNHIIKILLTFAIVLFLYPHLTFAQNWQALPPYNTLWPLWSSALSPTNPATGLPTPLVSSLTQDTFLPEMPGLTWDPASIYPWLLYNSPIGMVYFDPLFGINSWPPKYLLHGNTPSPIVLPPGYSALPPTSFSTLKNLVPAANLAYLSALPSLTLPPGGPAATTAVIPPPLTSLLTAAAIVGTPLPGIPMAPITPAPPTPIIPAPVPTVPVPTAAISALTFLLPSVGGGSLTPSTTVAAPVITNWSGLWNSLLNVSQLGPMNLTLSQNTTTGAVTGTASLILNKLVPLPVTVSGTFLGGTTFTLTGIFTDYQLALSGLVLVPIDYTVTLNCTITSATTMSGTYSIISLKESDFGSFNVTAL